MNRKHPLDRYVCIPTHTSGSMALHLADEWTAKTEENQVGYVVSIYGGFAPTPCHNLRNGFRTKKQLAEFCHANGFAIYWRRKASK